MKIKATYNPEVIYDLLIFATAVAVAMGIIAKLIGVC